MTEDRAVAMIGAPGSVVRGLQEVRNVLAPDLTDDELRLFAMVAARSGLDPFAKQIYAIKRKGRVTFQTGIDGLRSIAARTGEYDGQDEPEYGPDCPCQQNPKPHPLYAVVRVYRKGVARPIPATAYWHEYLPVDTFQWVKMPHLMLAKVAEALALRKAFPWDPTSQSGIGGDLYTPEEMVQAERPPDPSVSDRLANRRMNASLMEYDKDRVLAVANELWPDHGPISAMTLDDKRTLLAALDSTSDDGVIVEGEAVAQADPTEGGRMSTEEGPTGLPVRCGAEAMSGVRCVLPGGHPGSHHSEDDEEIWP
jgi:phage recombination protein Bet